MKYSPRPKLNENGVSDPRKFILIDVNGEKVLFEAQTAVVRDEWVNAITFQFELAKGIAPTTVSPRITHAVTSSDSMASVSSMSSAVTTPANSRPSTIRPAVASKPSPVTFPSVPTSNRAAPGVVVLVDSDDDDDGGNGGNADDDALMFPAVPSSKGIDDDLFPSVPDSDVSTSSTIDSSLFPSVPGVQQQQPTSTNTIDDSLFPSVPTTAAPAAAKPTAPVRRPTLPEVVAPQVTLKPDAFPSISGSGRSPRDSVVDDSGGFGFPCRLCSAEFGSRDGLQAHTLQTHNRDLTFSCLFPGCRSTYTEEANLLTHMRNVHPTFARDNCYMCDEEDVEAPQPVQQPVPVRRPSVPTVTHTSAAAVEMTLDMPDPKTSLYSAFLLGADAPDEDKAISPVVPARVSKSSAFVGKTSADAIAAVAAEKARRERAAQAAAAAVAVPTTQSAPVMSIATTPLAPPARATTTSGVIGGGDDDIPDAPSDIPDAPSILTPSAPNEEPEEHHSTGAPFSAMALLNARKHMKAPPSTKGVSLAAPASLRPAQATSPRAAPRTEGEKTPAMLESLLRLLLKTDEKLNDTTRAAAVANWMTLFDGKWPILQRLVDDYAGLVRVHALQPNTAYKKMAVWEKGLFKLLPENEAAELRKQKMFFMESLELPEIEEHIAKHWALVEAKKKQAAEAERKAAQGAGMMGVLGQLKQRGDEQRARELAEAAANLPKMEKAIEFDDDL